ncbi:Hypothetical protein PBC10988_28730 [Planctomycetales bacterium 10988]|nr:Hypothetical protein PBC10988_28730 [Planctomycetales bacterium 10988]
MNNPQPGSGHRPFQEGQGDGVSSEPPVAPKPPKYEELILGPSESRLEKTLREKRQETLLAQLTPEKWTTIFMLAALFLAAAVGSIVPVFSQLYQEDIPIWVWVLLAAGGVQVLYILLIFSLPDWSTLWLGMLLYGLLAAGYGLLCFIVMFTAEGKSMFLGLDVLPKNKVGLWCGLMTVGMALLSFSASRVTHTWRKEYEVAKRARVEESMRARRQPTR